jgi:hypothetical protein
MLAKHEVVGSNPIIRSNSSHSIKALHYIGNVETLDRYQLGAPQVICPQAPVQIHS